MLAETKRDDNRLLAISTNLPMLHGADGQIQRLTCWLYCAVAYRGGGG